MYAGKLNEKLFFETVTPSENETWRIIKSKYDWNVGDHYNHSGTKEEASKAGWQVVKVELKENK